MESGNAPINASYDRRLLAHMLPTACPLRASRIVRRIGRPGSVMARRERRFGDTPASRPRSPQLPAIAVMKRSVASCCFRLTSLDTLAFLASSTRRRSATEAPPGCSASQSQCRGSSVTSRPITPSRDARPAAMPAARTRRRLRAGAKYDCRRSVVEMRIGADGPPAQPPVRCRIEASCPGEQRSLQRPYD